MILAGICLLGIAFLTPNAGYQHNGSFFKIAMSSVWSRLFELPAAWCSLKIILSGVGLMLLIESFGTILARLNHTRLAVMVFTLEVVPCVVLLIGSYYLVKAMF